MEVQTSPVVMYQLGHHQVENEIRMDCQLIRARVTPLIVLLSLGSNHLGR